MRSWPSVTSPAATSVVTCGAVMCLHIGLRSRTQAPHPAQDIGDDGGRIDNAALDAPTHQMLEVRQSTVRADRRGFVDHVAGFHDIGTLDLVDPFAAQGRELHQQGFPSTEKELARVPAVGQYVGNAILLFQHDKPRPLVDVNMARVVERVLRPRRLADIRHDPWLQSAAAWLVRSSPVETNWAVLDFAAKVCRARNPLCDECPLARQCSFAKVSGRGKQTS